MHGHQEQHHEHQGHAVREEYQDAQGHHGDLENLDADQDLALADGVRQLARVPHPLEFAQEDDHGVHAAHRARASDLVGEGFDIRGDAGSDGLLQFLEMFTGLLGIAARHFWHSFLVAGNLPENLHVHR